MKTQRIDPKLAVLIAVLTVALVLAGTIWFFATNVIVGGAVYPRNAEFLNLRDKELTVEQFNAIRAKLPECELYWSVPFQGRTYPENTPELKVTTLSQEDLGRLDYFEKLQLLDARGCTDYEALAAFRAARPDVVVAYTVSVDGTAYPQDAKELTVTGITDAEIALLQYLPQLTRVNAQDCTDYGQLAKLKAACPELALDYTIDLCGESFPTDTAELTLTGLTGDDAQLLQHFHSLTKVHLVEPVLDAQTLLALPQTLPGVAFTWEKSVLGVLVHSDDTELDLTNAISEKGALAFEKARTAPVQGRRDEVVWQFALNSRYPVPDRSADTAELIRQVEEGLAYFPNVETVNMGGAFLDNEAMAKFREDHRQDYKVVWTVSLGTMVARTDTPYFMPYKYGIAYFFDDYAYNLRYCEDIVCIDVGHMSIHKVDFVEFMPKLKYLILAHTQVSDITPLSTCKSLVFLELDWSNVRNYAPLQGCTALQDLNLGNTWGDVEPLYQMTWLKHLWISGRSVATQYDLRTAFEGTEVELYLNGEYTVGGGWREMENYFAMRDALNMDYM